MKQHSAITRTTQAIQHHQKSAEDLLANSSAGMSRRILWIDGVGGFQLIERSEIVIGQAVSAATVDVCIVGDLSRQAAEIRRDGDDYLLQAFQPAELDGRPIDRPQLLRSGSLIQLGNRIKIKFIKPSPLSATARLDMASLNRFKPHVDGVLLLADSCIIGPAPGSHVLCPAWNHELLLFRHSNGWFFRTLENVEVDGRETQGQIPMVAGMRMRGADFSLSVE
ncbi:MAG: hypothetical protein KDB22_01010 [Planctomycetales bacterium]|nr:hypothetical protein [Planctomycetales bacterium]